MFRALSIISLFCFALFAGCSNIDDFYKEAGSPQKIERILDHFTQISVGEKFLVQLKNDTNLPETIDIDYFENLNAKISTSIENGLLTIKDLNGYNWTRDLNVRPKITINVHNLNHLDVQGACELNCIDTIFTNQLTINMHSVKPAKIKVDCGNLYGGSNNLAPIFLRDVERSSPGVASKDHGLTLRNSNATMPTSVISPSKTFIFRQKKYLKFSFTILEMFIISHLHSTSSL